MNTQKATQEEKVLFYLWLNGELRGQKNKNYAVVYCLCPSARDDMLKEFLEQFGAHHRYFAMRKALEIA